jgi:hypothetical protein
MNIELQTQLAQIRQQALLAERSNHSPHPRVSSWIARVQHWLRQSQALNRATALNQ